MRIFDTDHTSPKTYLQATHRARTPQDTLAAFRALMPRLGITRLANVTGLDVIGMPVYMAVRPNSRGLAVSQGKGLDVDSAKVSALMESIESWHGERVDVPLRHDSFLSLREREAVVDVTRVTRRAGGILRLDLPMLFARGWDLLQSRETWVPYEAVSTNFVTPRGVSTFLASTNGLAAGNHLLEAACHAVCEIIERDAIALWSVDRGSHFVAGLVDLSSVQDPCCRSVLDRLEGAGIGAAVYDVTSDTGIPAYASTIFERTARPGWRRIGMFSGYGCHLDPAVALMRSLSEAVQIRLTTIAGSRDDLFYRDYVRSGNEDDRRALMQAIDEAAPGLNFQLRSSLATPSFEGDLEVLLGALRCIGIESAVVVDLSRPEVGVPVVKVVIPGLEAMPLAAGYSRGPRARKRLEEVRA